MTENLRCPTRRQIIRYQVDTEPHFWHDLQYKTGMTLRQVHTIIQRKLNIPMESMATFFIFGTQLYVSLHPFNVCLGAYPVDSRNSENGRILHMYIQTKGKLFETDGYFVRKERFSNNGKGYSRR